MSRPNLAYLLCLLAAALLAATQAQARTIDWGSTVGGTLVTSSGSALDSSFSFELGTFGFAFTPTESNMADWQANWKPFDRAYDGVGFNSTEPLFVDRSATLLSNGTSSSTTIGTSPVFANGERAYIWVYNTQTYKDGLEWALITGTNTGPSSDTAWFMPSPSDQSGLPLNWRFDTAATALYGGLNKVQGPGEYSKAPESFELQTHTIAAIPEPSSAMLLATVGALICFRRRRRA